MYTRRWTYKVSSTKLKNTLSPCRIRLWHYIIHPHRKEKTAAAAMTIFYRRRSTLNNIVIIHTHTQNISRVGFGGELLVYTSVLPFCIGVRLINQQSNSGGSGWKRCAATTMNIHIIIIIYKNQPPPRCDARWRHQTFAIICTLSLSSSSRTPHPPLAPTPNVERTDGKPISYYLLCISARIYIYTRTRTQWLPNPSACAPVYVNL